MLRVIADKKTIDKLVIDFLKALKESLHQVLECRVGYQGGSFVDKVNYSPTYDLWLSHFEHDKRYWNGFGFGLPSTKKSNSIIGEINFPYEGINRQVAGAFALDSKGKFFVLHRGTIGGGKKGVGKNSFLKNYQGKKIVAKDGESESIFCVISELGSKDFITDVVKFIGEISRVKNILSAEKIQQPTDELNTYRELILQNSKPIQKIFGINNFAPISWLAGEIKEGKTKIKHNSVDFILVKIFDRKGQLIPFYKKDFLTFYVLGTFRKSFVPIEKVAEAFADFYLESKVLPNIVTMTKEEILNDLNLSINIIRDTILIYDREGNLH